MYHIHNAAFVADIGRDRQGRYTEVLAEAFHCGKQFVLAQIYPDDVHPLRRQRFRNQQTESAGRAGDDRNLTLNSNSKTFPIGSRRQT